MHIFYHPTLRKTINVYGRLSTHLAEHLEMMGYKEKIPEVNTNPEKEPRREKESSYSSEKKKALVIKLMSDKEVALKAGNVRLAKGIRKRLRELDYKRYV